MIRRSGYILLFAIIVSGILSACSGNESSALTDEQKAAYMEEGAAIVADAQKTLGGALMKQISDSGIIHAIDYCNLNASGITAGISEKHGKTIYRRTLKPRNPENKAKGMEKNMLKVFEFAEEKEAKFKPVVRFDESDSSVYYYAPIVVQTFCLQCHGTKDNGLARNTIEEIFKRYPKDKAFNYEAGDLRGMWVVEL